MEKNELTLYKIKNLTFSYNGGRPALSIDELSINESGVTCFIGPNGSGKTTLLKILAGLLPAQKGTINFPQKKTGFTLQHPYLFDTSVYENIKIGLSINRFKRLEAKKQTEKVIEQFGLQPINNRKGKTLSSGEIKLVDLARIFALDPDIFLLDEPLAGVDQKNRLLIMDIFKKISAETTRSGGKKIIIASHDQEFLAQISQDFYCLDNGIINHKKLSGNSKL